MKEHFVKCWPVYFQAAWSGDKPFEIRENDRGYQEHHKIHLQEWDPVTAEFTGRYIFGTITYKTEMGMKPGWVAFAWKEEGRGGKGVSDG